MEHRPIFHAGLGLGAPLLLLAGSAVVTGIANPAPPTGQPVAGAAVKHPNLFLNAEEIAQIQRKISTQPWAARLFDKVKAAAEGALLRGDWGDQGSHVREAAL